MSSLFDPVTGECIDIDGCRTTTGIIWSCLSVIFICTWVSIHPNIPLVGRNSAATVVDDIILMVIALLAPELVILWAMRQWSSANKIARQFKKYGWGKAHAFFVLMGGFALYDGDNFCGYLWEKPEKVDQMYWEQIASRHQKIQEHYPPEDDPHSNIVDQSHGSNPSLSLEKEPLRNTYSESTCLLEFLVANGFIRISEDEIKDRSHADILSKSIALIQTTWFLLQVAARAFEGLAVTELEIMTVAFALLNFGTCFFWWNKPLRVRHPHRVYWQQREYQINSAQNVSTWAWVWTIREGLKQILEEIYEDTLADGESLVLQFALLPIFMIWHILALSVFLVSIDDGACVYEVVKLMFSSRLPRNSLRLYVAIYTIAAVFGAFHCIPWAFQFPTHTERLLWRTCAVAVAAAPIAMGFIHGYFRGLVYSTPIWLDTLIVLLLGILYIFARVTLIVLALMALRDLSPSAYQTVQWTTFIPHIG